MAETVPKTADPEPSQQTTQPAAELSGKKVKLQSSDNEDFEVPLEYANQSVTIKNLILDMAEADDDASVPLPNISSNVLKRLVTYWEYHWVNPVPPETEADERRSDNIMPWDLKFMEMPVPDIFDMILAANFLDIKPLLDLCCKTVANSLKHCRTPDDMRAYLGVENDFSPEEYANILKETSWHVNDEKETK